MKKIDRMLLSHKEELETHIKESNLKVFRLSDLRSIVSPFQVGFLKIYPQAGPLGIRKLISFLKNESNLKSITFDVFRPETLYTWNTVSDYELLPTLIPKGYYSHKTAAYFHRLVNSEPDDIYFNNEQTQIGKKNYDLDQSKIDLAFKNKQRLSTAKTNHNGKTFWYLNGKNTGNLGVIPFDVSPGTSIRITDVERTLVDIVVRPAYSGGPKNILSAYRLAVSKVNIDKLITTLRMLDYTYPYHQSIGFYLERSGVYDDKSISSFYQSSEIRYRFYLDYHMDSAQYDRKWSVYYPSNLEG